jgi:hypothetical protein
MRSSSSRLCAIGLVVVALLTVASTAEAWVRPANIAVSSPTGGLYEVCRDGMLFQVADNSSEPHHFVAYSPPTGMSGSGTIVAEGDVVMNALATPLILDLGDSYSNLGTKRVRWQGGQFLKPGVVSVELSVFDPVTPTWLVPEPVGDCYLFPAKTKRQCKGSGWRRWEFKNRRQCLAYVQSQAREACTDERQAGPSEFRAKYGTGRHHRHALRNCVRQTT